MARMTPEQVEAALTGAGWHPGRDIGDQVKDLVRVVTDKYEAEGFPLEPIRTAVDFVREYGNLRLDIPGDPPDAAVFTPHWIYEESGEDVAELAADLGTAVFPVGYDTFDRSMILIDTTGRFFLIHHTGSYFLGSNTYEAVSCLLRGPLQEAGAYFV
ncbi:SUKH-3 domain-containing protein [Streptomyces sp. NPDC002104]